MKKLIIKIFFLLLINILFINKAYMQKDTSLTAYISEIVLNIFPTKIDKQFKKYIKTNDFNSVDSILNLLSEEDKNKAIKENPISYNLLRAMIAEEKKDTITATFYYSLAHNAENSGMATKRDKRKLRKLLDVDYPIWINRKRLKIDNKQNGNVVLIDKKIKEWNKKIEELNKELDELEKKYDTTNVEHINEINVIIQNIYNYKQALEDIKNIRDEITNDTVIVRIEKQKTATQEQIIVANYGIEKGEFCNETIKESSREIIKELIEKETKNTNIKILSVGIKITGHSDGYSYNKKLKKKYRGSNINQDYYNKDGIIKTININDGDSYNNEELAFLRAYCAYIEVVNYLNEKDIKIEGKSFYAIEHKDKDKKGTYRGIEIDMIIFGKYDSFNKQIYKMQTDIKEKSNDLKFYNNKLNIERARRNKIRDLITKTESNFFINFFNKIIPEFIKN